MRVAHRVHFFQPRDYLDAFRKWSRAYLCRMCKRRDSKMSRYSKTHELFIYQIS
jgi:hypothetical protein